MGCFLVNSIHLEKEKVKKKKEKEKVDIIQFPNVACMVVALVSNLLHSDASYIPQFSLISIYCFNSIILCF